MAPAPIGRRVAAYLIDSAVAFGVLIVGALLGWALSLAVGSVYIIPAVAWLLALVWLFVYTWMQGGRGSIGMRAIGLRLARVDGAGDLGFGKALLRNIVWWLAASIVVGYFTPLFDSSGRRQGWHDKASAAEMLDARTAAPKPLAQPAAAPPPPPTAPMLQAPTFDALPPAPVGGFAPSVDATPAVRPGPTPAVAAEGAMIAHVPGITSQPAPQVRPPASASASATPAPAPVADPVEASSLAPAPVAATPAPVAEPVEASPAPREPSSAPATVRPQTAPPAASDDLAETRITRAPHAVVLIWDDGTRHTVSGRTLFGRNPAPEDGAVTVAVRDETLSLSKTHVEVDVSAQGAWVIDRHSTNGVTIVRAGRRIPCAPGVREPLQAGDALEIGDRVVTLGGLS